MFIAILTIYPVKAEEVDNVKIVWIKNDSLEKVIYKDTSQINKEFCENVYICTILCRGKHKINDVNIYMIKRDLGSGLLIERYDIFREEANGWHFVTPLK